MNGFPLCHSSQPFGPACDWQMAACALFLSKGCSHAQAIPVPEKCLIQGYGETRCRLTTRPGAGQGGGEERQVQLACGVMTDESRNAMRKLEDEITVHCSCKIPNKHLRFQKINKSLVYVLVFFSKGSH